MLIYQKTFFVKKISMEFQLNISSLPYATLKYYHNSRILVPSIEYLSPIIKIPDYIYENTTKEVVIDLNDGTLLSKFISNTINNISNINSNQLTTLDPLELPPVINNLTLNNTNFDEKNFMSFDIFSEKKNVDFLIFGVLCCEVICNKCRKSCVIFLGNYTGFTETLADINSLKTLSSQKREGIISKNFLQNTINGSNDLYKNNYCKTCKTSIESIYYPSYGQNSRFSLSLPNSTFKQFKPSNLLLSCSQCSKLLRSRCIDVDDVIRAKCTGCFSILQIKILRIFPFTSLATATSQKGSKELYKNNSCKHYKKSFRSFSFTCCNTPYPCDICHDTESGHPLTVANKMICGFCGKSQGLKDICIECKRVLKGGNDYGKGFWNGGSGVRDKVKMSKKDSKKYKK